LKGVKPSLRAAAAAGALWLLCVHMADAQSLWGPAQAGMTPGELKAAVPQVERSRRPDRLPNGLRGTWTLSETPLAGEKYETVFYFKDDRLQQVAQTHASTQQACDLRPAFEALLSRMRASYGLELAADDRQNSGFGTQTASWVANEVDIAATLSTLPNRCAIRVSYKPRLLKDASAL
jgi:hypothetical protein